MSNIWFFLLPFFFLSVPFTKSQSHNTQNNLLPSQIQPSNDWIEPAPFSFKLGWGLTTPSQSSSTSSPTAFLHQSPSTTTTATSTSTENLTALTPNHARHSTDIRDPTDTCKLYDRSLILHNCFFIVCNRIVAFQLDSWLWIFPRNKMTDENHSLLANKFSASSVHLLLTRILKINWKSLTEHPDWFSHHLHFLLVGFTFVSAMSC